MNAWNINRSDCNISRIDKGEGKDNSKSKSKSRSPSASRSRSPRRSLEDEYLAMPGTFHDPPPASASAAGMLWADFMRKLHLR